jgi:hypothetical protein
MPLDGQFQLNQLHDGMTTVELMELWDDLVRLQKLVEPDTFGEALAAVCPDVTDVKIKPCPLKYAGFEDDWNAIQYAFSIGATQQAQKALVDLDIKAGFRPTYVTPAVDWEDGIDWDAIDAVDAPPARERIHRPRRPKAL